MADTFKITDQRQTTRLKPNGGFEDVMEIAFTTVPGNVSGQIMVPLPLYNADHVRTEIESYVERINAVGSL